MNPHWIDAAAQDDLWDDSGTSVVLNGLEIALFRVGDAAYATDNLCSHGQARLCDGFVEGHEIECPLHQGRFDLRTGQASAEPAVEAIRTYPVRIEGGRVYVWLE
jgi:naphthalene 1,2-dioxygenase system ferredoxin subunit